MKGGRKIKTTLYIQQDHEKNERNIKQKKAQKNNSKNAKF